MGFGSKWWLSRKPMGLFMQLYYLHNHLAKAKRTMAQINIAIISSNIRLRLLLYYFCRWVWDYLCRAPQIAISTTTNMKLCLVFRHIPFCEGKVNNYPKQYSYYFCKHPSSPPFMLFLLLSLGLSVQSAPNCDKDNSEFDDDHESCHKLSPPSGKQKMRQPKLSQKNANSDSRQTKRILCKN